MRFVWATRTHTGMVRDHNEDSVYPEGSGEGGPGLVVAVADGMGGHVGGEVASTTAIEAFAAVDGDPEERILSANEAVVDRVEDEPKLAGMGTTLTAVEIVDEGHVVIGHVGDSRAYLHRNGELRQITRDHSLVGELVEDGELTPEQARLHPYRSVITRALGLERVIAVDTFDLEVHPGDVLLICSDGLTEMLPDHAIAELLDEGAEPGETADRLVEAANHAGGHDNVSVALVVVEDDGDH